MPINPFEIARLPRIVFGEGRLAELPFRIREFGRHALLVTGRSSFPRSAAWRELQAALRASEVLWEQTVVAGEPSPQVVDEAVRTFHGRGVEVVVGIGGGSVLDAAKAIAGLLIRGNSVLDHLEDVGRGLPYQGPALPLIAVPTTAGTGSEATKNAVLSVRGPGGYKKSFRHDSLVPALALVDPLLLANCPRPLLAAQGMDAFTQLLESFLSRRANRFTDALAWSGLEAVKEGLLAAWEGEGTAASRGRAAMAYAALLSGITLAQVGLGAVHGLAQPLGSLFPIPHGVACGSVLAATTAITVRALRERQPQGDGLKKYALVGRLLADSPGLDDKQALAALVGVLEQWTRRFEMPRLSSFGVVEADIPAIVAASRNNSMKSHPLDLTDAEIGEIVRRRL